MSHTCVPIVTGGNVCILLIYIDISITLPGNLLLYKFKIDIDI